jgi:hypothetical protein
MKTTNNKLEHKDYQPPQGMLHSSTSGKKHYVDLATQI